MNSSEKNTRIVPYIKSHDPILSAPFHSRSSAKHHIGPKRIQMFDSRWQVCTAIATQRKKTKSQRRNRIEDLRRNRFISGQGGKQVTEAVTKKKLFSKIYPVVLQATKSDSKISTVAYRQDM
jgi:hypothetical protein